MDFPFFHFFSFLFSQSYYYYNNNVYHIYIQKHSYYYNNICKDISEEYVLKFTTRVYFIIYLLMLFLLLLLCSTPQSCYHLRDTVHDTRPYKYYKKKEKICVCIRSCVVMCSSISKKLRVY